MRAHMKIYIYIYIHALRIGVSRANRPRACWAGPAPLSLPCSGYISLIFIVWCIYTRLVCISMHMYTVCPG